LLSLKQQIALQCLISLLYEDIKWSTPLREAPRRTASSCDSLKHESSLLDWLEAKDRLIAGDVQEPEYIDAEQEIPELAVEDVTYDIEDEDENLIYKRKSRSGQVISNLSIFWNQFARLTDTVQV